MDREMPWQQKQIEEGHQNISGPSNDTEEVSPRVVFIFQGVAQLRLVNGWRRALRAAKESSVII